MTALSPQALMVLVKVMEREVSRLEAECDAAEESDAADLEEILLDYSQVREEVRQAYAAASAGADNLPSVAELLRRMG